MLMESSVASCILFGVLAAVRRPFEANLFKHGYQNPVNPFATPSASRGASPVRSTARTVEKHLRARRMSTSTRSLAESDIETLDLSYSPVPPTIYCPSPQRSVGLGIFTSDVAPPPIPPQFMHPLRSSSIDSFSPLLQPTTARILTRPPRLSGNTDTPLFVPLSFAPQYSASTWRALHPESPSSLWPASQSHPHLPSAVFLHHNRFSHSSVSLTRPQRLSTVTANDSESAASGTIRPEARLPIPPCDEHQALGAEVLAIIDGTSMSGTIRPRTRGKGHHKRTSSAPDASFGAQESPQRAHPANGLQPPDSTPTEGHQQSDVATASVKLAKVVRSSSAEQFMSRFSPDSSPDNNGTTPRRQLERNLDIKARVIKGLPFTRSSIAEAAAAMVSNMPRDLIIPKARGLHLEPVGRKKMNIWADWRNKPLTRIAHL